MKTRYTTAPHTAGPRNRCFLYNLARRYIYFVNYHQQ